MRSAKGRSLAFTPATLGVEYLDKICLLSGTYPVDEPSGNPNNPVNTNSSGGDPAPSDPGESKGQQNLGAFLPDPSYHGDPANAPLVTSEAFCVYLTGIQSSSWQLSEHDTGEYVSPEAEVISASLENRWQKILREVDAKIVELRNLKGELVETQKFLVNEQQANLDTFNAMTPADQNTPAGQLLLAKMLERVKTMTTQSTTLKFMDSEIGFLNDLKTKINNAFLSSLASIRKDYGTSGGPGHEFYQNDNFYFV